MAYLIIILMTLLFTIGTMWASHFAIQGRFQPLFRRLAGHLQMELESYQHDHLSGTLPPTAQDRQLHADGAETTALQVAPQKNVWLTFCGSLGIEETVLGLRSPHIPKGLKISSESPRHKSLFTWFPDTPHPTDWCPYSWVANKHSCCLGQLSNGYFVVGIEGNILPLMSAQTRSLLASLGEHESYEIKDGEITVRLPGAITDEKYLKESFGRLAEIADALSLTPAQRTAQLMRMLKSEKNACLRTFCLEHLYHHAPDEATAKELDQWALAQPDRRLHLLVWMRQGAAGLAALKQLFAAPGAREQGRDRHHIQTLRCVSLRVLLHNLPAAETDEYIEQIFGGDDPDLWIILISWAAHNKKMALLPRISQQLSQRPQLLRPRTIPPLLELISHLGNDRAFVETGVEAYYLQLLEDCDSTEIARLLLPLLASWGSAEALTPLYRCKKLYPALADPIDACCEHIRSRIGPVEAGGLSLSEGTEGGQVSLAQDSHGAVSIA